jgi:RNA polymerase sigma-70 factor (ECF subfamily)
MAAGQGGRRPAKGASSGGGGAPSRNHDGARTEEAALVRAAQAGDRDALTHLLHGHQERIYNICYRMVRNADQAGDLTQESLVRILEGFDSFDGRSAVSTWITRVTINCCLSQLRRERLRRHGSIDDRPPEGVSLAELLRQHREQTGVQRIQREEARGILMDALRRLEPTMRAIIVLRDLQDLDYQAIADVLEIPVGTVKSRLFRARAALRAEVSELAADRERG